MKEFRRYNGFGLNGMENGFDEVCCVNFVDFWEDLRIVFLFLDLGQVLEW